MFAFLKCVFWHWTYAQSVFLHLFHQHVGPKAAMSNKMMSFKFVHVLWVCDGSKGGHDGHTESCVCVCVVSALPACEYIYQRVSVMVWADNSEQRLVFCHPYISPTESHRAAVILLQMFCLWERRSLFLCFSQCVSKAVLHVFLLNCLKDTVVNANDVLCSISAF